jgi:hypothetical protein
MNSTGSYFLLKRWLDLENFNVFGKTGIELEAESIRKTNVSSFSLNLLNIYIKKTAISGRYYRKYLLR